MRIQTALTILFPIALAISGCNSTQGSGEALKDSVAGGTAPAYDPATATSRVYGSVLFDGVPPVMESIQPGGSRYCVINARGLSEERVLVTKDKKLKNVVVYIRSGWQNRSYEPPAEPVLIDQRRCLYIPHVVTIETGQKLKIMNNDDTFHNVHAQPAINALFNIAQPAKGSENVVTFTHSEAPFRVGCDLHSWMSMWVAVFDHPFHSTSGDSGNYEIKLPAGKYEIAAWHETLGEKKSNIEVAENAQVPLNFTFSMEDEKPKSGN